MTIITNRKFVALVLVILAVLFLYISFTREDNSAEEETAALLREMGEWEESQLAAAGSAAGLQGALTQDQEFVDKVMEELPEEVGEDFFVNYRLERDRNRSQQVEMLEGIVNNPNSSAEARQEAQNKILQITGYMEQELQLETLLTAKGYTETAILLKPDSAMVIVKSAKLASEDLTRIADLVSRTTGHGPEQIVIIPKN